MDYRGSHASGRDDLEADDSIFDVNGEKDEMLLVGIEVFVNSAGKQGDILGRTEFLPWLAHLQRDLKGLDRILHENLICFEIYWFEKELKSGQSRALNRAGFYRLHIIPRAPASNKLGGYR